MTQAHEAAPPENISDEEAARRAMRSTAATLAAVVRIFWSDDGAPLVVYADELEGVEQILTDALLVLGKSLPFGLDAANAMVRTIGVIRFTLRALRAVNTASELILEFEEAQGLVEVLSGCRESLLATAGAQQA